MILARKADYGGSVFPLTSLQIGDLQAYLSDLRLFLALESNKFYILVDNRPWLRNLGSRPAHFWQLMVTKSRLSPFANTKPMRERKKGREARPRIRTSNPMKLRRWSSLIDALSRKRVLLPVKNLRKSFLLGTKLHRTLYGFIVFEVSWSDVRGINYLNELQTDTSLAVETKCMRRWEFDSIAQAAVCISSWFSGSQSDQTLLSNYLDSALGEVFYDAKENFMETTTSDVDESMCTENLLIEKDSLSCSGGNFGVYSPSMEIRTTMPHTPPPPTGPYKRRRLTKSVNPGVDADIFSEDEQNIVDDSLAITKTLTDDCENVVEATQYKDVLILFRFNDHHLPFELRHIIMSDLRLLTLLEAGLPSWVIFLQSYPVFCHVYRPWMCPLARVLYVLISAATVLIGFYDLYKNVPLLKATASSICGPLLDWIETWEMVSRIKYLGTMLFLHNVQMALKWFLKITSTIRSFFRIIAKPLIEPLVELFGFLLPIWNMLVQVVGSISSSIWIAFEYSFDQLIDLFEILLSPIWFILLSIWKIATFVLYPLVLIIWQVLYAPIQIILSTATFLTFICTSLYSTLEELLLFLSTMFKVASASEATVSTVEVSKWHSLWNDLFSHIFRALRSILNGFVAFFATCNRHRLSIYNHLQEFFKRVSGRAQDFDPADSRQTRRVREARSGKWQKIHIE